MGSKLIFIMVKGKNARVTKSCNSFIANDFPSHFQIFWTGGLAKLITTNTVFAHAVIDGLNVL